MIAASCDDLTTGRHQRWCDSRPTATISATVARTDADRVWRWGT